MARPTAASQDTTSLHVPLAERLRPRSLGEVVGQQHLLGEGMPLRIAFESGRPHSLIFCFNLLHNVFANYHGTVVPVAHFWVWWS